MAAKVYIVVLNWNNAPDTLECLESLFRLDYPNYHIVVCDNASSDDSVATIEQWARGEKLVQARSSSAAIRHLSNPPVAKPVYLRAPDRNNENGDDRASLTLIRLGRNRGYASGNNAGIRFAVSCGDADFVWILNNDTVVESGALSALVSRAQADPDIGICGSLLRFYDEPDKVQAAGGAVYHPAIATPTNIGQLLPPSQIPGRDEVEAKLDFIVGASALVSRRFLLEVGLMSEDYFLYYEEVDWAMRAPRYFRLGFASDSVVFHKEGASAGSDSNWRTRSEISDLCAIRNRLIITRRFFAAYYPIVFATIVLALVRRLWRRQPGRARQVFRMLIGPESYPLPLPDGSFMTASGSRKPAGKRRVAAEKEEEAER